MKGQWTNVYSGDLPLRSWWVDSGSECEYISIVLPEVFEINHWIRSFSEKLAKQNITILALPLYGRTAPKFLHKFVMHYLYVLKRSIPIHTITFLNRSFNG